MMVMCAKITFVARKRFGGIIHRVNEVQIQSSWKELTSRAEITLPRNVPFFNREKVKEVFQHGDPVKVELGYDGKLFEEFTGYITQVSADIPIKIRLEDEMWKLKQMPVNFSARNVTLDEMLRDICKGYEIDALEGVQLGSVRFSQTTVAKVLDKLRSDFNLYTYMSGKKLVCGKYYSEFSSLKPVKFNLERNLVNNDLNYRSKEDVLLKIKGTSILKNGKRITCEIGETGGDQLTLSYYNITLQAELERLVKIDYERRKQDGFDGTITAFGTPRVQHSWKVDLESSVYPDRNGLYYIEGVNKTFGPSGYRQVIKLGNKVK